VTIPNGVDMPNAHPKVGSKDARTALFLGRLYPVKGLPLLIEAWSKVRPTGWRLVLAGPDEAGHRAELEALIARYHLQDTISFAGPLEGEAKEEALFAADLFVLPSYSESFGMAVGEALAHGVPVLTTTAVPWPTLRQYGLGWRVPVSVDGLAAGLSQSTALDSAHLSAMGKKAATYISAEFGWDSVAKQFLATYAGIVAKSSAISARG
jgi:glycosyltransferase involved in cell wall biosynthesis